MFPETYLPAHVEGYEPVLNLYTAFNEVTSGINKLTQSLEDTFASNGAFVHKYPILPIVVKYEDESLHHNHDNGESMLHSCLKLFLVKDYNINIKVCDMVEYKEDETIDEYKDRVYKIMNDTYKAM